MRCTPGLPYLQTFQELLVPYLRSPHHGYSALTLVRHLPNIGWSPLFKGSVDILDLKRMFVQSCAAMGA